MRSLSAWLSGTPRRDGKLCNCESPRIYSIREDHKHCKSCGSHDYRGIKISKKDWDHAMDNEHSEIAKKIQEAHH